MTDTTTSDPGWNPLSKKAGESDCPFCLISLGSSPARIVYEDPENLSFFPLSPAALGHTLVIPRRHFRDLLAVEPAAMNSLMDAVLRTANAINKQLHPDGMNFINSSGAAATQTVPHVHFHIVPRWDNDSFGAIWPERAAFEAKRLDELALKIRSVSNELPHRKSERQN
ncbi:HIT family protein [Kitasatospora sp. NPDC048286]|uniref:HIT family protein n=1 Tax=Kitasatospora sp. NPDC048286 TaxID=3364047 RepID=UPI00371279BD